MLAGVLVAGFVVPAATVIGVGSEEVTRHLSDVPVDLATPPQPQRTTFYLADGHPFAEFYDENRVNVPLERVAPVMRQAQVAIEDHRFYDHGALDLKSLVKAVIGYAVDSGGGGGSTLTQQYVKQVLIEDAMRIADPDQRKARVAAVQERSAERKITEARYAIGLEQRLTKDQILENYLNIVYYGDGAYGVEAAAHHYFNTTAADLTLAQAAMLAGIVQTPSRNPVEDLPGALARRDVVLGRMAELGIVTSEDAATAKREAYDPGLVQPVGNGCVNSAYSILCEFTRKTLMHNPALGVTPEERNQALYQGGYDVHTVIDPTRQAAVQAAVSKRFDPRDPVIATLVYVEPGTGDILAMAQNRYQLGSDFDAGETAYVFTADEDMGGAEGFRAGSTVKAFTVAAALDAGVPPGKRFDAAREMQFGGRSFETCRGEISVGDWSVGNANQSGVMTMSRAAAWSVNTYFVQLEAMIGICAPVKLAMAAGVHISNGDNMLDAAYVVPSWTLGIVDVSPLTMATAFATFAARGVHCDPVIIRSITAGDGTAVQTPSGHCHQVIPADVADGVNSVLTSTFTSGPASSLGIGRPAAGTADGVESGRALWFMGYTPDVVGAATIAIYQNPKFDKYWAARGYDLNGNRLPVSGTVIGGAGGTDAGRLWQAGMKAVVKPGSAGFHAPSAQILSGKSVRVPAIPRTSTPERARDILEAAGFFVQQSNVVDPAPVGALVGHTCEGYWGGTCTLSVSLGPRWAPD